MPVYVHHGVVPPISSLTQKTSRISTILNEPKAKTTRIKNLLPSSRVQITTRTIPRPTDDLGRGRAGLHARPPQQVQVEALLQEAPARRLPAGADGPRGRRPRVAGPVAPAQLPQPGHALAAGDLRVAARRGRAVAHQEQLDARQRRRAPADRPLLPEPQRRRRGQCAAQSRPGQQLSFGTVVSFLFTLHKGGS